MYINKYGYIDEEGKFYECEAGGHSELCKELGVDTPEEYGWVKVFCGGAKGVSYYSRRIFLTPAQYKTLLKLGVKLTEKDSIAYEKFG